MSAATHKVLRSGSCLVACRHSQVRHPVQRCASDQQLRSLSRKAARTNSLAKDHLHAKDLDLGQRPSMVFTLPLPSGTSDSPDPTQVFITDMMFSFYVAVLPNLRSLLRRDRRSRLSLPNRVIAVTTVIRTIGGNLCNLVLDLLQQVRQQLRVLERVGRDDDRHELTGGFVHSDVEFAPRATFRVPMLPHLPFAFTVDFDACGIYNHVRSEEH